MCTSRPTPMVALLSAMLASAAAAGNAQTLPAPPLEPGLELASCVSGSPPLRVPAASERALLDAADRLRFQSAAQGRHPLYERGGQPSHQVLILRREDQWQYVTLQHHGAEAPCFTAVFAADRFDFTPAWLAKYQPRPAEGGGD
ncbi:MAG: hypothetical protein AB9M60_12480 [Leptothrix sp. (in: b-proteobacteria)]